MGLVMSGFYLPSQPFPSFVISFLAFLHRIQQVAIWIVVAVGLEILLDDEFQSPPPSFLVTADDHSSSLPPHSSARRPLPPALIRQSLPSSHYEPPCKDPGCDSAADSCTVCFSGLKAGEEVRRLGGCRHVFHVCCIDPWIDIGRRTCPLCRAQLVPQEMLRGAMIAAEKNIPGHDAVDASLNSLDSYSSSAPYLIDDDLYYGGDGDYYPVV